MKKIIMIIAAVAILSGVGAGLAVQKNKNVAEIPVGGTSVVAPVTADIQVGGTSAQA